MKEENENVETVTAEVIPNLEQPVIIQPTIKPPRVLLEILVFGIHLPGTDVKKSDGYLAALKLQEQIDKLRGKEKLMVRILWKTQELNDAAQKEIDESLEWLIENSHCKYYTFCYVTNNHEYMPKNHGIEDGYVKDKLTAIKKFEKALSDFKQSEVNIKKK